MPSITSKLASFGVYPKPLVMAALRAASGLF